MSRGVEVGRQRAFLVTDYLFTNSAIFLNWQLVGLNHL